MGEQGSHLLARSELGGRRSHEGCARTQITARSRCLGEGPTYTGRLFLPTSPQDQIDPISAGIFCCMSIQRGLWLRYLETLGTAWQIFGASHYGLGRFEVSAPIELPFENRFRLCQFVANFGRSRPNVV
jgi:hypothetical protein